MPAGDGTGPMGFGPMTGRAAGYCVGYPVPGFMNPFGGRFGRAFGAWMPRPIAGARYAAAVPLPAYAGPMPWGYPGRFGGRRRGWGRWGAGRWGMGWRRGRWF